MDYRVLWKDENEAVKERYYLAMERIGQNHTRAKK